MEKKFITMDEGAQKLNMSRRELKKLVRLNRVTAYRIGGKYMRFDRSELERFMREEEGLHRFRYGRRFRKISDFWRHNETYLIFVCVALILGWIIYQMLL